MKKEDNIKNLGIIPARMGSTRFPGKPLVDIAGKPMIQHVYEQCQKAKNLDHIVIATDSERIADVAKSFSADAILTSENHPTGMDRILETIQSYEDYTHIVNIQGDEPCISPDSIDGVLNVLYNNDECEISTVAVKFTNEEDYLDQHQVKVVFDYSCRALYFSRSPIPFNAFSTDSLNGNKLKEDEGGFNAFASIAYKHLGLYAYTREALLKIPTCKPSSLEVSEKLEQLRFLQNGMPIYVHISPHDSIGVDVPEDVEKVKKILQSKKS